MDVIAKTWRESRLVDLGTSSVPSHNEVESKGASARFGEAVLAPAQVGDQPGDACHAFEKSLFQSSRSQSSPRERRMSFLAQCWGGQETVAET